MRARATYQCDDNGVAVGTTEQATQPAAERRRRSGQRRQGRSRPLDDELAQIFAGELGDPEDRGLTPRGRLGAAPARARPKDRAHD